jgi:hypothetical protein
MEHFKLRFYHTHGIDKGGFHHEEFFQTKKELETRYNEVFVRELYSLNPTAWELGSLNHWKRLEGF